MAKLLQSVQIQTSLNNVCLQVSGRDMSGQPKYILTERIAQGGMAEIHLGKSVGLDGFARICAFKRILPHFATDTEFIQMFRNEAMMAKQLQNKNIVQVFDFVGDGQSYMLVMEYVDGQDLRSVLASAEQTRKRIPVELACYIAIEILSGLSYAHQATDVNGKSMGIIHRDVSPQNILLSFEGDVKITDFGIAKATNQTSTTRAGVLKGKFRYMSPEQAMGQSIDARTDIFAIGVILYEMLTMTRLFKGEDMAVLEAVRQCKIKPPSQITGATVPADLETIVLKLLAKDPAKRFLNSKDAVRELSKFLYGFRPDFFAGELAEYMHLIFREKITTARERLRSTLALPVGSMGTSGIQDLLGRQTFADPGQSVMDMSQSRHLAQPEQPSLARAAGGSGGEPSQMPFRLGQPQVPHPPQSPQSPRGLDGQGGQVGGGFTGKSGGHSTFNRRQSDGDVKLEVVGGRIQGPSAAAGNGFQAPPPPQPPQQPGLEGGRSGGAGAGGHKGGASQDVPRSHNGAAVQQSPVRKPGRGGGQGGHRKAGSYESMSGKSGFSGLQKLGLALLAGTALFLGVAVYLKAHPNSTHSDLEIQGTPGGRVQVEADGIKLFNGVFQPLPLRLKFESGPHQVVLLRPGFKPKKIKFNAGVMGQTVRENVVFEKLGPMGQVRVVTLPAGAKITYEANQETATSPVTFDFIPIGKTVQFRIQHPRCPSVVFKDVLPPHAERQLIVRTVTLKNCK